MQFLILTATRTSEVLNAEWHEIDLGKKTWTVPAERMKARREHRVPLSTQALELLSVFPGSRVIYLSFQALDMDALCQIWQCFSLCEAWNMALVESGVTSSLMDFALALETGRVKSPVTLGT
ncbi:tyrosine-type recombinase/integrase [Vreelandella sp. V005]|uniref:tyrosine-type recombinase/integrase n=1 Tax=Vreelandella sp. V005 TaxID=3459608 RepID=UPI00404405C5